MIISFLKTNILISLNFHFAFQELDLTDAATFRDLDKPMGAQTPDRLKQFKKRYSDWEDPQGAYNMIDKSVLDTINVMIENGGALRNRMQMHIEDNTCYRR